MLTHHYQQIPRAQKQQTDECITCKKTSRRHYLAEQTTPSIYVFLLKGPEATRPPKFGSSTAMFSILTEGLWGLIIVIANCANMRGHQGSRFPLRDPNICLDCLPWQHASVQNILRNKCKWTYFVTRIFEYKISKVAKEEREKKNVHNNYS